MSDRIYIESHQILKNLNAVLTYSVERYKNEFEWQEIRLTAEFKAALKSYLAKKGADIEYFDVTSIVTTSRNSQWIFIANQWFAIGSYFVDFCTELLTYQSYFLKICRYLNKGGGEAQEYAKKLRTSPTILDKNNFLRIALNVLERDFPGNPDCQNASNYLWKFVSDYSWWAGSKYVSRRDFYISAVLNSLNVVNANSEFLAEIVHYYASNLQLRLLVENIGRFTINSKTKSYTPSIREQESYKEAEHNDESVMQGSTRQSGISISAASLERFKAEN